MKFPSLPIYLKAESLGRLTLFRIPNLTLLFQDFDGFAVNRQNSYDLEGVVEDVVNDQLEFLTNTP